VSDDGNIRRQVESQLDFLYGTGESEEKTAHRERVLRSDGTINAFQRTALELVVKAKQDEAAAAPPEPPAPQPLPPELAQDIPEPVEGYDDRPDVVGMIKAACRIITAVANWGKPQGDLKIGNRTEGIHVRCPFPSHEDKNPSAWINTNKDTWFCGGCQVGGDQIDFFAAAKHGLSPQDFHNKENFRPILEEMAAELGIDTDPPMAAPPPPEPAPDDDPDTAHVMPEPDVPPAPDNEPPTEPPEPSIAGLDPDLDFDPRDALDPLDHVGVPTYNWLDLDLARGTFLSDWMVGNTEDMYWVPPEYFIMLGFQALGLACGHYLQPATNRGPTNASLMLTLIGPSGCGKSEARKRMTTMFRQNAGSAWNSFNGTGIKVFTTPGSPEALLRTVYHDVEDPADPALREEVPVTALLEEDEFATFVSKANRKGGEHMKQRVMGFHDFTKMEPTPELVFADYSIANGSTRVHDSFFSATFLTQTDVIRTQVEDRDMVSGFMNRVIPVFGVPRQGEDPTRPWNSATPMYFPAWDATWRRVRHNPVCTRLNWGSATPSYLARHPYWSTLGHIEQMEGMSILSRLKHHACRLAFLLAVNEAADTVEPKHFEVALRFIEDYLQKCYAVFVSAAKATESRDIKDKLVKFLHDHMEKTNKWPDRRTLAQQRFWRTAPDHVQMIALDNLVSNHLVAEVILKHASTSVKILIATDRDDYWGNNFKGQHGKTYVKDTFYAQS
jgi:CHC2 zinc finger